MVFDPNHRHLLEKIETLEKLNEGLQIRESLIYDRIEKLEQEIRILKQEKANVRPFIWLNNRVGQLERRLDHLKLDDWEGDLSDTFSNLFLDGKEGKRFSVSC